MNQPRRGSASASARCRSMAPVRARNTSSRVGRRRAMSSRRCRLPSMRRVERTRGGRRRCRCRGVLVVDERRRADVRRGGRPRSRRIVHVQLDHVAAGLGLELGRRARGHDPTVVDDHDVGGQVVGLVEVLGGEQHVGARARRASRIDVPELDPAARIEAGRGLVEEQQAGRANQAGAEVEPAAACRRSRSRTRAVGGVDEAEVVEHARRRSPRGVPPRRCPNRRATISRFSRPVIVGSTAAYWPGEPDERADRVGMRRARRCPRRAACRRRDG